MQLVSLQVFANNCSEYPEVKALNQSSINPAIIPVFFKANGRVSTPAPIIALDRLKVDERNDACVGSCCCSAPSGVGEVVEFCELGVVEAEG